MSKPTRSIAHNWRIPNRDRVRTTDNTGGPSYLAVGAMLFLGAAVVAGRDV
jgi:hypothetical protein